MFYLYCLVTWFYLQLLWLRSSFFMHSGFFLHGTFNIFPPLTEGQLIRTFGLIIQFEKHKLQHAEEVEAGPVPFLPFSSSSSVLLQLSVEPWKMETSNKEWVDAQGKGGGESQTGSLECGWSELWSDTFGHFTHTDTQTTWQTDRTDGRLPPRNTNQPGRQNQSSELWLLRWSFPQENPEKSQIEDRVCAAEKLKFGSK